MKKVIARIILAWSCTIPLWLGALTMEAYGHFNLLAQEFLWARPFIALFYVLVGWPVIELIWWAYKVVFKPES